MSIRKNKIIPKKYLSRSGENHWAWKGDKVNKTTLHEWIAGNFGKAIRCEKCKTKKIPEGRKYWFEWSNKTGIYNRDIKNWWQLCIPCHRKFDNWLEKIGGPANDGWKKRKRSLTGQFI